MTDTPDSVRRRRRGRGIALLAGALALTTVTSTATAASAASAPHPGSGRGSLVSAHRVQHLSAADVRAALTDDRFDASRVRYGVDAYQLVYRTIGVTGTPTTASGLVVIPRSHRHRLRVVNYTHGTMAGADEAPSTDDGGRSDAGLQFAAAGYATVEPDYLGLGIGPGRHPYLHLRSETTASLDMLRAAFAFARHAHRSFDRRILVSGFSQGGQAAMALGKALLSRTAPRLRLAADAPISGPYALQHAELPAIFDGSLDPKDSAFYTAYLLTSWNRIYHLYDHTGAVFRVPYNRTVAPLYDGTHEDREIFAALPDSPAALLTATGLEMLRHPTGRLAAALRANDTSCDGWRAAAPIHLYAAHGDEQVAITNTYRCQWQLSDDGVRASVIDLGNYHHLDSERRGITAALGWFLHRFGT